VTDELLRAYDAQLRVRGELHGSADVISLGPLFLTTFDGGTQGFITYQDLGDFRGERLDGLIADAIAHFRDATQVDRFEWKTRGHDRPRELGEHLVAQGFVAEEMETVMVGEAEKLALDLPLPVGVAVRRAGDGHDLRHDAERASALQHAVFGRGSGGSLDQFVEDLSTKADEMTLWVAEVGNEIVCAGRLQIVPGTEFAGLWGGATHPDWRRQGIYRVLTAARAKHSVAHGVRYLNSDSTDMSKPILERSGLHAITTTTPYIWRRS
jgi:hypothetical protein